MKVESFLSAIIVLNAFYQASAQNVSNSDLQCFNCDPSNDAEGCINPTNSTTIPPLATCFVKYPPTEANSSYQCISAYLTFSGTNRTNSTGIYRDCQLQGPSVVDICDLVKQEMESKSATLVSCSNCATSACNNVTFTANGDIETNSGTMHNMVVSLVMMTVISALLHS